MIIQIDKIIETARTVDDVKTVLRLLQSAINKLSESKTLFREDAEVLGGVKNFVVRADDGKKYRLGVTLSSGTPAITLTSVEN